jgi:hypothetical protein
MSTEIAEGDSVIVNDISYPIANLVLNSPTEETAPNIFPNMTLTGKEVNKKTKDLSTSLQA